ncbi:polyprenyl synthetase family protein [Tateyamaria omphalii]|uniref:polyprenyl synthetase family protein n=1 Tax=Tateyamaria omphalii TaxID=299262 RepID=UPI001C998D20|nr:farnesyl diphosphate synthase [Tateyamaria omphalii]MBY5933484.1 polyprenyl synthetase family protein [Tateyamaria omphalii]
MFRQRLSDAATAIQARFDAVLGALDDVPVVQAMAHATNGGKRLRGFLVLESARLHEIDPNKAIWPATAIEALHAYSLVHDDLPCMDDDDLRRGEPTVHIKWDDATAVLAGDALQTLAFELCAHSDIGNGDVRADLALSLAKASGAQGMVLGQALDIAAETADAPLTLDEITALQRGKTGALIEWSATAGARMAQADLGPLQTYARALGLAFQIADDVLDVTSDAATMGKATGKDANAGKATFVSLLGLDEAKRRADQLVTEACDALHVYQADADALRDAARFVVTRNS